MYPGPPLGRRTTLVLSALLALYTVVAAGLIGTRIFFTIEQWDYMGPPSKSTAGKVFQIFTICFETLVYLPVSCWLLWRLWKRRLTFLDVVLLSVGGVVYWLVIMGATLGIMVGADEGLTWGFIYYTFIEAALFGAFTLQMIWALSVYFVAIKKRGTAGARNRAASGGYDARGDSVHLSDRTSTSKDDPER